MDKPKGGGTNNGGETWKRKVFIYHGIVCVRGGGGERCAQECVSMCVMYARVCVMHKYMSVCVVCAHEYECVWYAHECVGVSVCRSQSTLSYLFLYCSQCLSCCFETGSLTELGAYHCARLAVQEALGAPPVSFPKAEVHDIHRHVQAFCVGAGIPSQVLMLTEKALLPTGLPACTEYLNKSCVGIGRLACTWL